jgi:carboxypeptidase Taq
MPHPAYDQLCRLLREAACIDGVSQLLSWDQEVYMPPGAYAMRGEQVGAVATILHEKRTSPRVGELIAQCESDASLREDPAVAANLREMRRDYDLATKLPAGLVAELAQTTTLAQQAWKGAREKSNYPAFLPMFEKVLTLTRRKAECLGTPPGGEAYDALLDLHEPGMTAAEVEGIFAPLRPRLASLIQRVAASKKKPRTKCLSVKLPAESQHRFGLWVIEKMGFDLHRGRLDTTTHPFCSGFGPGDTRLTTRYRESRFTDALYGTLHEMGHGLYDQGLPKAEHFGQPLSEAISLGIHESQSRTWENLVGRSKAFWKWALPGARKFFGKSLAKWGAKEFFAATNTVTPSLIRVEADEGTYNMHVMVRFEVERALVSGALSPRDLPGEWNRRYKDYLGITVPDDRRGCLQDVHWSIGLFGYFPTYTLGNLYAAQFWERLGKDLGDPAKLIAKGRFGPIREWLVRNIHRHGRRYPAADLCRQVTGAPLSADPLLRHLTAKAEQVYDL